jgi:sugar phosphate permease
MEIQRVCRPSCHPPPDRACRGAAIFAAAWFLCAGYYFCRKSLSVVIPVMVRTGHYGKCDLAQFVFVFSLAYAADQFVAGALGDRFGVG